MDKLFYKHKNTGETVEFINCLMGIDPVTDNQEPIIWYAFKPLEADHQVVLQGYTFNLEYHRVEPKDVALEELLKLTQDRLKLVGLNSPSNEYHSVSKDLILNMAPVKDLSLKEVALILDGVAIHVSGTRWIQTLCPFSIIFDWDKGRLAMRYDFVEAPPVKDYTFLKKISVVRDDQLGIDDKG